MVFSHSFSARHRCHGSEIAVFGLRRGSSPQLCRKATQSSHEERRLCLPPGHRAVVYASKHVFRPRKSADAPHSSVFPGHPLPAAICSAIQLKTINTQGIPTNDSRRYINDSHIESQFRRPRYAHSLPARCAVCREIARRLRAGLGKIAKNTALFCRARDDLTDFAQIWRRATTLPAPALHLPQLRARPEVLFLQRRRSLFLNNGLIYETWILDRHGWRHVQRKPDDRRR